MAWHTHLSQTTLYCPPPTTILLVAKTIIQPSFVNTISLFLRNCFFYIYLYVSIVTLLYLRARFICLFWNLIFNVAAWIVERSLHTCIHSALLTQTQSQFEITYGVKSKTDSFCKYSKKLPNFPVQWRKQKYNYSWMSIRMIVIFSRIPVSQYTEWKKKKKSKSCSFAWVYVLFSFVSILLYCTTANMK